MNAIAIPAGLQQLNADQLKAAFFSTYFLRLGILDGTAGYTIARFAAYHARLKQVMLRELEDQADDRKEA